MQMTQDKEPVYILPEDAIRQSGKVAQRNNIAAAKIVAETVRTTLGPKGMDKMLVNAAGDVTVTNDGVTILRDMEIEHPAAKMIVEVAKTQEDEVGDGTTTAVVLAGELLRQAESLLEKNVHPTVIAKGYRQASEKADALLSQLAKPLTPVDTMLMKKIAMTAMTGKGAEAAKEKLSSLVIEAVQSMPTFSKEAIKLQKKVGSTVEKSSLLKGIIIDREKTHPSMPSSVQEARIALLNTPLEVRDTDIEAKISITNPAQMQEYLDMEETMITKLVEQVVASGANVVVCQKGVDDLAQYMLSKENIYALRRVAASDMALLAQATGGRIVSNTADLTQGDLGSAGKVEETEDELTVFTDCKQAGVVTLLVRGATEHVVAEVERAAEDAIGDVASALKTGQVVAGAGSVEVELSKQLRTFADSLSGKEQLAVKAFADALEIVPTTLAENAGLDPIDVVTSLKAAHDQGTTWKGIDVYSGNVMNAWEEGVIEPLAIKTQALASATEVAVMILRIDDVIAAGKEEYE